MRDNDAKREHIQLFYCRKRFLDERNMGLRMVMWRAKLKPL